MQDIRSEIVLELPSRWKQLSPPKHSYGYTDLSGGVSLETGIVMSIAVRTENL